MGLVSVLKEEGRQEGIQKGIQQGIRQGIVEGLLEGIEFGIGLKFGAKGMEVMPMIRKINNPDRLKAIKEAIKIASKISEIEKIIGH